ncbi:MAG: 4-(cytidine 5'-diphospho)-2-C-methyl-D-erythritol kinase, partial [Bacteroidetes bacterium]|nr:4-(cytidine 5'-diphospho)-2-C-methyl-D-erythritol kinase [Bacteroidota bacterium]
RADGFHNIESVFLPIQLADVVEIIDHTDFSLSVSGLAIDGDVKDNLCYKAFKLLQNEYAIPNVAVYLHKVVPMGAGLGGGSSNAAFILKLLNEKFKLGLNASQRKSFALQLGSDCAFFIDNKACYAQGRGELTSEIQLDLSMYKIMVVHPGIHVNTGWAYSQLTPKRSEVSLLDVLKKNIKDWNQHLTNDFEAPIFLKYPEIKEIKETFYRHGAVYASMSGSGSAVYALFPATQQLTINFPDHYFRWEGNIIS